MAKLFSLLQRAPKRWISQLKILKPKTNTCKLCFKSKPPLFNDIFFKTTICDKCFQQFKVIFKNTKIGNTKLCVLYEYNEIIKTTLYQLKGLSDIILAPIYLERYLMYFRIKYYGFYIVPAPSTKESDDLRGFNHVEQIFSDLKLEFLHLIEKRIIFKQSDLSYVARQDVADKLIIINGEKIRNKKILIVDDVKTSGATIQAIINLLKPFKPKCIEVLVVAQTKVIT